MLWSMIKILLFVTIVAALAYGSVTLLEVEGDIRVVAAGVEVILGPLQAVILGIVLLVLLWLALKAVQLLLATFAVINGDDTAITRFFYRRGERRGFQALADGMMALASGEARLAMAKAQKAERLLRRPELTNLLAAQAAELSGDSRKAEEIYKRMLQDDRTRFVGVRGIMKQKLDEGDNDKAMKLAEKAFALKPRHAETADVLLKLQAGHGDWTGARKTLGSKLKHGQLPRDVHRRRDAILALSEATAAFDEKGAAAAREAAVEANRLSPDLVPAAVLAARVYIADNNQKYAARVLKKAWESGPHPDLAAAYAAIAPDETPDARIQRFQALTRIHPDHSETKMLLAELHIAAEDFPSARRALGNLTETYPIARSLSLMAAIERGMGAPESEVRAWLAKAITAPRGPQWVCDVCGTVHDHWMPVCDACGSFDSLTWRDAPRNEVAMPGAGDMMPILTAAPARPAAPFRPDEGTSNDIEGTAQEVGGNEVKGAA